MADQGVSNERKKELEQNDPFQVFVLNAIEYVREHKKMLAGIIGAGVGVILILSFILLGFEKSENKAANLLVQANRKYSELAVEPRKAYEQVKDDFNLLLSEYANTNAGRQAVIDFARICFKAEAYQRAHELFEKAHGQFKGDYAMENFFLSSLGHVCLAEGNIAQAKSYFEKVAQGNSSLLKDEAKFILANLHEREKDDNSSHRYYQDLVNDHKNSIYHGISQSKVIAQ